MRMSGVEERILQQVASDEGRIIEHLKDLVRVPSVVGHEGPCQDVVRQKLADLGMTVEEFETVREEVATHPAYIDVPWSYAGRPNVVACLPGAGGGRSCSTGT